MSSVEERIGSPEKPLSDLGLVSYRNYWKVRLSYVLRDLRESVSIEQLSRSASMTVDDTICALENLQALLRDPVTNAYALRIDIEKLNGVIRKWEEKGCQRVNPVKLKWAPFLVGTLPEILAEHEEKEIRKIHVDAIFEEDTVGLTVPTNQWVTAYPIPWEKVKRSMSFGAPRLGRKNTGTFPAKLSCDKSFEA